MKEETTFNDSKPVVVNFEYDELGRLVGKDANSITSSYAYNLQGWLTRSSGHYYSSQLKYYDGSNPSYTGNISEWKWGNRSYRFEYDNLGRISDAHYYEGNTLRDDYSEKNISYDLNGNIRSLTRYDAGVPETLDYTYTNGILKAVGNKSIVYDGCGNITFNGRNNLEIDYNFLNLPMRIHSTDGQSVVNYRYLADGSKFSATDDTGEGLIYIGSLVYRFRNGAYELDHAVFSQGFFRKNHLIENHEYVPVYYVCDHLGSPRSLIDHTGELMVLRNYYPFGKTWRRPTEPAYYDYYHFNGKEQQTVGDAGLLDYGARFYDPDIARWLTQDPLADVMPNINSYVYCANNPVKFIDPTGMLFHKPDVGNNQSSEIKDLNDDSEEEEISNEDEVYIDSVLDVLTADNLFESPDQILGNKKSGPGGGGSKISKDWNSMTDQEKVQAIIELVPSARERGYINVSEIPGFTAYGQANCLLSVNNMNIFIDGKTIPIFRFAISMFPDMRIDIAPDPNTVWIVNGIKRRTFNFTSWGRANTGQYSMQIVFNDIYFNILWQYFDYE